MAWLSLDASDNDPARFWRHAVAALDAVYPGIGERVGPLLGPPAPQSFEGLVTALINELAARSGPGGVPLVLDDYHLVGSQPVHASLGFLLDHLPPGLHPVLASRADPPLGLARLRARGQLTELRDAELRFTADEAAAFLRETAGADLPDTAVAALTARTEGWAAGLQLAALSMRGQPDVDRFVAAFTGSHRFVLDYLTEEVLEHQPEQLRAFLLETSVLQRLSGPLCDAVTARTGSQALLEQVERAGLFLLPLDEVRGWWRYHQLFADLLRARLEQQPGRAAQLHRNAAAWYAEHDLADDAIGHAVAAGEMTRAARLIEEHFDERFYLHGEVSTVRRWLALLPPELAGSRARLLLARARLALLDGGPAEAEGLLDLAERASADADHEVRAVRREGVEPAGERPGGGHAPSRVPRRASRRRRDHRRSRPAGHGRQARGRSDARHHHRVVRGHGRVAARPPGRSRAIAVAGRRPALGRRRGLPRRLGLPCPLPGPAGSGPAGRGGRDLPPDAGDHGAARKAGRPGRRRRLRQPGRGCLPAR